MRNKYLHLFLASNFLILIDQFTKMWVQTHIPQNHSYVIWKNFLALTHIRNPGVAFGLFASNQAQYKTLVFVVFSIIAIIAILVFFHQTPKEKNWVLVGLILIFSGAIGNLIDRIVYKEVVDFLDFSFGGYHWPAFNIADSCITTGVGLLFIDLFTPESPPIQGPTQDQS